MKISEIFYSLQGEGKYTGVPSIFIRASDCNLRCNGAWKCDTWDLLGKGEEGDFHLIFDFIKNKVKEIPSLIKDISLYNTHIVLTGGEPFMNQQGEDFARFLDKLGSCFTEVETNGTQIHDVLFNMVDHITCSPKLCGSGQKRSVTIKPDILFKIMTHKSYCFKFVISSKYDMEDVLELAKELTIPKSKIYLMPAGSTREELQASLPIVWGYAEQYGFKLSTRLHIEAFDNKKGV